MPWPGSESKDNDGYECSSSRAASLRDTSTSVLPGGRHGSPVNVYFLSVARSKCPGWFDKLCGLALRGTPPDEYGKY